MSRNLLALIAFVVVGVSLLSLQQFLHKQERAEWEQRVEAALDSAADARAVAAADSARAEELGAEVAELKAALTERGRRTRERVVVGRAEETPDSCATFVAWRDRVIDDLVAEADGWRDALETQERATERWQSAYRTLSTSHDRLEALLEDRPKARPWWAPRVGVGAFAGATMDGRPALGVGLTVSWEVF